MGSLNVKSEHYGPLLIPIILEQLPDDIKLQVSRTLGRENWQIEEFMTTLKLEIAARESCNFMNAQSSIEERAKWHIKTEALMIGTKLLVCAFCSKDHYHDKCSVVTNFEERKEIARKNRLCYKCLIRGNIRNCRNMRNCFHCKASNHHSRL